YRVHLGGCSLSLRRRNGIGNIFETCIFSEYLKSNIGKINFWRTQDKKEIDFIINSKPYEVKLNYDGRSINALDYFQEKYGTTGNIITLKKSSKSKYNQLFPWEV
ncbi:MAG: DUF4143 domain-containing protein, partial [Candidatus Absconditabacteria bacterium]